MGSWLQFDTIYAAKETKRTQNGEVMNTWLNDLKSVLKSGTKWPLCKNKNVHYTFNMGDRIHQKTTKCYRTAVTTGTFQIFHNLLHFCNLLADSARLNPPKGCKTLPFGKFRAVAICWKGTKLYISHFVIHWHFVFPNTTSHNLYSVSCIWTLIFYILCTTFCISHNTVHILYATSHLVCTIPFHFWTLLLNTHFVPFSRIRRFILIQNWIWIWKNAL